jgi:hypothetical protein
MLLKRYTDSSTRLGLGQLFGVLGLIGLVASGALGNPSVFSLIIEESRAYDFLRGFAAGLSGGLLGLSLVFSVAGLISVKNERTRRD